MLLDLEPGWGYEPYKVDHEPEDWGYCRMPGMKGGKKRKPRKSY